ncbi:dihydroxyacetone kinase subunit DhaL [Neobacillus sp. OS1-2]|uniref:dihydroxyacetone kinase subunit DhaL n=1 Tax=Neobacillus sp. OS1-2 TaxID=3070680 RepID=UPI0027DEB307|nr:dihydroxyacetone kinase subunit DhaL [Neobacillus sp. OS1-2]WML41393.1 dihydroxyacetone kinase subunit DhaL [Neobacillus sp. OS1-2]
MSNSTYEVKLNAEQVKDMFLYVGEQVIENKPFLTKIDSAIGDGDHGIGMSVGFKKADENLNKKEFTTINDVFKTIGMSMIANMGGASGVIFGTLFTGGVKGLNPQEELTLPLLGQILEGAVKSIKERGKAELGDKTMIDALEPAAAGIKQSIEANHSLLEGLVVAEKCAADGVEKSKEYVAKFGRAKSLGERAIGHQDAGATTVWIMFKSMREWVEKAAAQQ